MPKFPNDPVVATSTTTNSPAVQGEGSDNEPESRSFLLKIFSGILLEKIGKNLTRRFILLRKPRFVLRPLAPTLQGDRRIAPTMT